MSCQGRLLIALVATLVAVLIGAMVDEAAEANDTVNCEVQQ